MTEATVAHATSRDGTSIGYWTSGGGPPLVLVHGGTADHSRWRPIVPLLEPHATVHAVDRRGRGASGDAADYDVEREFEDVAAVADSVAEASGEPVTLLGHSFGGACAIGGAALTRNVGRLVLYEPTLLPESTEFADLVGRLERLLAAGRTEEMLVEFFREAVMMPEPELTRLRSLPAWQGRLAAAHTLPRELRAVTSASIFDPERAAKIDAPTLLLLGGDSPEIVRSEVMTVAETFPDTRVVILEGQQHVAIDTAPELFAGHVVGFLPHS